MGKKKIKAPVVVSLSASETGSGSEPGSGYGSDLGYESAVPKSTKKSKAKSKVTLPSTRNTVTTVIDPEDAAPTVWTIGEPLSEEAWSALESEAEEFLPVPVERLKKPPKYLTAEIEDLTKVHLPVDFSQQFKDAKSKGSTRYVEHDATYLDRISEKATPRVARAALESSMNLTRGTTQYPETIPKHWYETELDAEIAKDTFDKQAHLYRNKKVHGFENFRESLRFDPTSEDFKRAATTAAKDLASQVNEQVEYMIRDMDVRSDCHKLERNFHPESSNHPKWIKYDAGTREDQNESRVTKGSVYPVITLEKKEGSEPSFGIHFRADFVDQRTTLTHTFDSATVLLSHPDTIVEPRAGSPESADSVTGSFRPDIDGEQWQQWEKEVIDDSSKAESRLDRNCKLISSRADASTKGVTESHAAFAKTLARARLAETTVKNGASTSSTRFNELLKKFDTFDIGRKMIGMTQRECKNLHASAMRSGTLDMPFEKESDVLERNTRKKRGKVSKQASSKSSS